MTSTKQLKVAVIGSTGYAGSHTCIELLGRGHHVTGVSRNPEKIGKHANYKGKSVDLEKASIEELVEAFSGQDVVVNTYGPHTGGETLPYMPYIEITRKIVIAIKYLKTPYLIEIGGTGSLSIPGTQFGTAIDSEEFWVAYFQHAADSKAYISYAETRFPKFATLLHRYRDIRQTPSQDRDQEDLAFLDEMRSFSKSRILESYFIMACRASLLFFEGNTELEWTFLSPPPGFKPGPRTGKYVIGGDAVLPVEGDQNPPWEGRLLGITVKDLAGVIVDECEGRKMKGKHWTVWTPKEDAVDEPIPNIYGSLNELEQK